MIQECRSSEIDSEMNRRAKYDKTSRSKNVRNQRLFLFEVEIIENVIATSR